MPPFQEVVLPIDDIYTYIFFAICTVLGVALLWHETKSSSDEAAEPHGKRFTGPSSSLGNKGGTSERSERVNENGLDGLVLLPLLRIWVRWPDLCCRCGASPAPRLRKFELEWLYLDQGEPQVEFVGLSLPLCSGCFANTTPRRGILGRLFPEAHEVGQIVEGKPAFTNEAFERAFQQQNAHLHGGPRLKLPPGWHL